MNIHSIRVAALVCAALGAVVLLLRARSVKAALTQFMLEPSSPLNLAGLRIVVFGMICSLAIASSAPFFAALPAGLRSLPLGWGFLDGILPFDAASARFAKRALIACSALAALGIGSRITTKLAALLALFVLGLPNFYFKIDHSSHILMMCALVLAVSPCGDALAIDRLWKRGSPVPGAATVYTLPVRFCWLLIGTVYLFPGLWKLWQSGDRWMSGEQLLAEMYDKWGQLLNFAPPFRIDQYPLLLSLLGIATLVFEIGFFFALFNRYTRIVGALSAVGFHLGVLKFMGIRFHVYFPLVILLDFPQIWLIARALVPPRARAWLDARLGASGGMPSGGGPLKTETEAAASGQRSLRGSTAALVMGSCLLVGQFVTGFGRINTWPISVHPTFSSRQHVVRERVSRAIVVHEPADGRPRHELTEREVSRFGTARLLKLFKRVRGVASKEKHLRAQGHMLVELLSHLGVEIKPGDEIVVYDTSWDVFPLGARANSRRTLMERLRVRDDFTLESERRKRAAAKQDVKEPGAAAGKDEAEAAPDVGASDGNADDSGE